jgi:hypothetical protein
MKVGDYVISLTNTWAHQGGPERGKIYKITSIETCPRYTIGIKLLNYRYVMDIKYATGERANWPIENFRYLGPGNRLISLYYEKEN